MVGELWYLAGMALWLSRHPFSQYSPTPGSIRFDDFNSLISIPNLTNQDSTWILRYGLQDPMEVFSVFTFSVPVYVTKPF